MSQVTCSRYPTSVTPSSFATMISGTPKVGGDVGPDGMFGIPKTFSMMYWLPPPMVSLLAPPTDIGCRHRVGRAAASGGVTPELPSFHSSFADGDPRRCAGGSEVLDRRVPVRRVRGAVQIEVVEVDRGPDEAGADVEVQVRRRDPAGAAGTCGRTPGRCCRRCRRSRRCPPVDPGIEYAVVVAVEHRPDAIGVVVVVCPRLLSTAHRSAMLSR